MGETTRCAKCKKGITDTEKAVFIDEALYHLKCYKRIEEKK